MGERVFQNRGVCVQAFPSLPSPPPSRTFCARPNFRAAKIQKMPRTCGKPYGNACYAGYSVMQPSLKEPALS